MQTHKNLKQSIFEVVAKHHLTPKSRQGDIEIRKSVEIYIQNFKSSPFIIKRHEQYASNSKLRKHKTTSWYITI